MKSNLLFGLEWYIIKVTVIGFWGGFPAVGEATSGYLFEKDGFRLLVDCGSGVVSQLQKYIHLKDLNAVVLSHYHHDHVADIGPLQYGMLIQTMLKNRTEPLAIYGHLEDGEGFKRLAHEPYTKAYSYDPTQTLIVGPFRITFLKTNHPVPCYAMRITDGSGTVIFTADSSFKREFIKFSQDADLLICECNFYAGMDGKQAGHMNSTDAATIAHKANVKHLLLTHLPHFGDHQELVEDAKLHFNGKLELAQSGWNLSF
jgi:ribonuclease BN (tRNA processing enzyme)